jgi:hypothetical protein
MAFASAPFPAKDPIAQPRTGLVTDPWIEWLTALIGDVDASPARLQTVTLTLQGASIGTTSIPFGALDTGLYRVSYYARITRAATTSSSLTVTLGWTEGGISLTSAGAAMTGNTTGTVQSGTLLIRIDAASPVSYATTYASVGATSMQYRLDVLLEQLDA